jgi:hypothetical protein
MPRAANWTQHLVGRLASKTSTVHSWTQKTLFRNELRLPALRTSLSTIAAARLSNLYLFVGWSSTQ